MLPLALRPGFNEDLERSIIMAAWLRESGSLTARLQAYGTTKVMRVRQNRALPNRDELWFLGLAKSRQANQFVMIREVVLEVDGVPWVFAHTLANAAAMRLLRRAGRNALAVVLFTDPKVSAGPLQYCRVDARHPLYRSAQAWCKATPVANPLSLMARRALFQRGAARLLVTEVFLPPVAKARPKLQP
jgi:chorismate--pyruvate lyase